MPRRGCSRSLHLRVRLHLGSAPYSRDSSQQEPFGWCALVLRMEEDDLTLALGLRPVVPAREDSQVIAELLA